MVILDGFLNSNFNMVESSQNWNLANDVELLKRLEKFAENVINNASTTLNSMDNLEDSISGSFLRVRTVANKFQTISDNQFIENRVQEEEFELDNEKKEVLEAELSPEESRAKLQASINECQNALRSKFETVQISEIDSEDEMANSSPIVLVPKNVYKERRLPHLIGGERFISDETLGLVENEDVSDGSIENEEDADETDRSSNYTSSIRIIEEEQVILNKNSVPPPPPPLPPTFSHEEPPEVRKVAPIKQLQDFSSDNAVDDSDLFSDKPRNLFDENIDPTLDSSNQGRSDSYHCLSNSQKSDEPVFEEKKIKEPSRDQLLSGHNIASFKQDLARVLSRTQPFAMKKQSSTDSENSRTDFSSPIEDKNRKGILSEPSDDVRSPLESSGSSTADSVSFPVSKTSEDLFRSNQSADKEQTSDFLPNVSINTLEHLAKGRAKVKGKRRPPSRKHRQGISEEEENTYSNRNPAMYPSNSNHSIDKSNQESTSTQPGSNILSPATDEEDLFVLPAFDLPTDPPSRGLFFGNSLLSPGEAIDDEGSPTLFPPADKKFVANSELEKKNNPNQSKTTREPLFNELSRKQVTSTEPSSIGNSRVQASSPESLTAASSTHEITSETIQKIAVERLREDDLFSVDSANRDGSPNDLFFNDPTLNVFSSSPPLFKQWEDETSDKNMKRSQNSSLTWDLLGSNDLDEDLFRMSPKLSKGLTSDVPNKAEMNKEEDSIFSPSDVQRQEISGIAIEKDDIFSSSTNQKKSEPLFFEDEDEYSSNDLFSGSHAFMRLNLPKNASQSLFASDDENDEDDDSLFKSSNPSNIITSSEKSSKSPDVSISNRSAAASSSRNRVQDPLMPLEDSE